MNRKSTERERKQQLDKRLIEHCVLRVKIKYNVCIVSIACDCDYEFTISVELVQ